MDNRINKAPGWVSFAAAVSLAIGAMALVASEASAQRSYQKSGSDTWDIGTSPTGHDRSAFDSTRYIGHRIAQTFRSWGWKEDSFQPHPGSKNMLSEGRYNRDPSGKTW